MIACPVDMADLSPHLSRNRRERDTTAYMRGIGISLEDRGYPIDEVGIAIEERGVFGHQFLPSGQPSITQGSGFPVKAVGTS
jgi:hypothetical protein